MKEKIVKITLILTVMIAITYAVLLIIRGVKIEKQKLELSNTLGVWWWHSDDIDKHLDFAHKNGVDEIYYSDVNFDENTVSFISKANALDIKVYALWGEHDWGEDRSDFDSLMNKYKSYNASNPTTAFSGVHLDIEPHQFDDFDEYRSTYLYNYVKFVYNTNNIYGDIDIHYDIPFWFDDEITYKDITKKVYEHVIDNSDKVVVMSYRDSATEIYDTAIDELRYANSMKKSISISVEMNSNEGDKVSFKEEDKRVLYSELEKLPNTIVEEFGVAIHHIETWYNLDHGYTIFDM